MSDSIPIRRFPRSGWWIFIVLGLSVVLILLAAGYPIWRQLTFIWRVEGMGGEVSTLRRGPLWLRQWTGNAAMRGFDEIMSISGPGVDDALLQRLAEFPEIQEVRVKGPAVSRVGISALARHPNLFVVDLFDSQLDDSGMAELANLPILEDISAGYTNVTDTGLFHAGRMKQLSYLGLRGDRVTDAGLAHLSGLTGLIGLHLGETDITDEGLVHLSKMAHLCDLWLYDTKVSERGVRQVVADHVNLRELTLSPDQISADGLDELQRWRNLKIIIQVEENDGSGFSRRRHRD